MCQREHTNLHVKNLPVFSFLVPLQGKNREKEEQKERGKEKEAKEKVCGSRSSNRHYLVPGAFSSCATCSLCSKTLQRKHGLQCMNLYGCTKVQFDFRNSQIQRCKNAMEIICVD
uniref:Uncharacterized protein n=1 Tax=Cyclopterus lumpus TaxID=8103 RepID=A0A8C3GC83_CYCLU